MSIWKFILILLGFFGITLILFRIFGWEINFFIVLGALGLITAIGTLFYSLGMISFNSISYFMRGGYIFSLIITTMYSISLIGMFQQFPFTCEGLNEASNKLFQFVEKPFLITFNKKQNDEKSIKNNETSIATMPEGTVYLVPMETDMIEEFNEQEILGNEEIIQDEEIVQDGEVSWNEENSGNEKAQKPVISKIAKLKSLTIDQVLNEQEAYSSDVCELLLNEINSKFGLENFKWSVILLIYLLLYGFIRISFWVMSGIAFIIFKILYRCRVYKISETTKKVDEIH